MSRTPLKSASRAEHYYSEGLDEYFSEKHTVTSQWQGRGAAAMGLSGEVRPEDFRALLEGRDPHTGQVLIPASTSNNAHRAGWDACFSTPKSVSIQALIGGDVRLIQAHQQAVAATIPEIEKFALTHAPKRPDNTSGYEISANLIAATFQHYTARPVTKDGQPDPHIHSHAVILNMTENSNGDWRAAIPLELYRCQAFGSALYLSELAKNVQQLGYGISLKESWGAWELDGYTPKQVDAFSQREKQIREAMRANGIDPTKSIHSAAGNVARLNTRNGKGTQDEWELETGWRDRAADLKIPLQKHLNSALRRGPAYDQPELAKVNAAVNFARDHVTERDAVVDRRKLEQWALQKGMGQLSIGDVRKEITIQERNAVLVRAAERPWYSAEGAFTTQEMLALERENLQLVRAGAGKAQAISDPVEAQGWALAKGLLPDQIMVVSKTLASNDWVTAIEGPAGSTKTTTVNAVREYAESQGYKVFGFGMTSGSVDALRGAGLNAQTIASLLANPPTPDSRQVWIVDESSLIATKWANRLLTTARDSHVERIIFVGDQRQHQSIEAGAPIRQFLRESMAMAELTEIRRQQDPELKRAVEEARERPAKAMDLLSEQGRIHEMPDTGVRYSAIALEYLRAHEAGQKALVVSPANDERRDLNQTIRALLVKERHVDTTAVNHNILVNRNLTAAQRQQAASYREGDIIHFVKGAPNIPKRMYFTVQSVDASNNCLTLSCNGRPPLTVSPAKWRQVEVYEWEGREFAIGDRVQWRVHDRAHHIPNGAFATITALNKDNVKLQFRTKDVEMPLTKMRHVDHGYASTSHAAQGATVDKVLVNIDSMRGIDLVNQQQFYVSVSRARLDAQIFTDDVAAMKRSIVRDAQNSIALDAIATRPTQRLEKETTQLQQQPQHSIGI